MGFGSGSLQSPEWINAHCGIHIKRNPIEHKIPGEIRFVRFNGWLRAGVMM